MKVGLQCYQNGLFEQKFSKEGFQNLAEIKRMLTKKL